MLSGPGRLSFDPLTRRRYRRLSARLRPLLLPALLVVVVTVALGRLAPAPPPDPPATIVPSAPAGRVLVAVTPTDAAVLELTAAGVLVDVYGTVDPYGMVEGLGAPAGVGTGAVEVDEEADTGADTGAAGARLLASAALVVGPGGPGDGGGPGLDAAAALTPGAPAPAAVTLAVTDLEAAALAAQQGRGLMIAVRPGGAAPPERDG